MDFSCKFCNAKDHPRLRRTNNAPLWTIGCFQGSPPLTQDKFCQVFCSLVNFGITPAYAGQIAGNLNARIYGWDHPRLRRTNMFLHKIFTLVLGSPPLTQDKLNEMLTCAHYAGITPAYAGQITSKIHSKKESRDHPRLRRTNSSMSNKS